MFKNMTIGKRIGLGFGAVLGALAVVVYLSFSGVGAIVGNAEEVIYGNSLDASMTQREVDHLDWVSGVNKLLTDESVCELHVETDHHKCGFGKWLYSDERTTAEAHVPGLAQTLKEIEEPHRRLHESAISIDSAFVPADAALPGILAQRGVDHLKWAAQIRECFLTNADKLAVQTDPTQCALGKWLEGEQARKARSQGSDEFRAAWDNMIVAHKKLHHSAIAIGERYRKVHPGLAARLDDCVKSQLSWANTIGTVLAQSTSIDSGNDFTLGVENDATTCLVGRLIQDMETQGLCDQFPELKAALEALDEPHKQMHAVADQITQTVREGKSAEAIVMYANTLTPLLNKVNDHLLDAAEAEAKLVAAQDQAKDIFASTTSPLLTETLKQLDSMQIAAETSLAGVNEANSLYATETMPNLEKVQDLLHTAREQVKNAIMTEEAMLNAARNTKTSVATLGVAGVAMGILLAFITALTIIRRCRTMALGLSAGSRNVSLASDEIASGSQTMAEGASEQAAALEETTSSLHEMGSMLEQTAENAAKAQELANAAENSANEGVQAMQRMNDAIIEIKDASDETAKIVKTIDEIAFQTNLLALNAAVEAARAGEAGKGFAVVAEEVRNLAQRSAEAARSTADLITGAATKANNGVVISQEVSDILGQITTHSKTTLELVSEIAAAGTQQADGIQQITASVNQMDQVSQNSAGTAEESAAASEELNAQARELDGLVGQLLTLVGSNKQTTAKSQTATASASSKEPAMTGITDQTWHDISAQAPEELAKF